MTRRRRVKRGIDTGRLARPAQDWDCGKRGHMWHHDLIFPSRVTECSWCVVCSEVHPDYTDPQKKWDK